MIYNYVPGDFELLSLQSIGSVGVPPELIKIENGFTNIFADLHIYTDSSGTAEVPGSAIDLLGLDEYVTGKEETESGKTAYKAFQITNATYQGVPLWVTFNNFGTYTDNQAIVDYMTASRDIYNPRRFTSGRIDSQELTSGTLSTPGWYTIAETDNVSFGRYSAVFNCVFAGTGSNNIKIEINAISSTTAKTTHNTTVRIIATSAFGSSMSAVAVRGARLAKSDSVSGAGFKVQIDVRNLVNSGRIQITENLDNASELGFFLVTPYLDNTPTLPDGVTPATFIEAGAELSFGAQGGTFSCNKMVGYVGSANQLRVTAIWDVIPKQGTGLTLFTTGTFAFNDPITNTNSQALGSFTISNFVSRGNEITFIVNQTGIATGMTVGRPSSLLVSGADGKLTITG